MSGGWRRGGQVHNFFPCFSVFFLFSSVVSSLFAFFFLFAPYYLPSQRTVHSDLLIQPRAGQSKLPLCCSCQNYPPLPSAHRKHCVRRVVRRAARTSSHDLMRFSSCLLTLSFFLAKGFTTCVSPHLQRTQAPRTHLQGNARRRRPQEVQAWKEKTK